MATHHLSELLDRAPLVATLKDTEGRYQLVNRAFLELFGLRQEQVFGRRAEDLFAPEVARAFRVNDRRILEAGGSLEFEETVPVAGRERVYLTTKFLLRDASGRPEAIGSIAIDVTERKRTRAVLAEAEQRFRTVVEHGPDAYVELDVRSGRFVDANDNACAVFGFMREQLLATGPVELSPARQPDGRPSEAAAQRYIERALAGEAPQFRWVHLDARGNELPVRIWLAKLPHPTDARVAATLVDLREIEATRLQLQQAQRLEGLGRLAGGIAHDFNNLLTVIQGGLEFIGDALAPDAPERRDLEEIQAAAARARDLTAQMLAFARQRPSAPRLVRLPDLVERTARLVERLIGADVRLVLRRKGGCGPARIDPVLLEQAIVNLVLNARDAMPRGGELCLCTSAISLEEREATALELPPGRYVRLEVQDEGTGMAPEIQERVFEPFFTTKDPGRGTGLGLSMVYGIVRQADGAIRVDSTPGEGSRFEILLPEVEGEVEEPVAEGRAPATDEPGQRVLLLEDDARVRAVTRRMLARAGYEVLEAADGEEALALVHAHAGGIAVLVSDVVMPGTDGFEVAEAIRAIQPGIPVLFVSGYAAEALAERGRDIEGVNLLSKPFSPAELVRAVRQAAGEAPAPAGTRETPRR